MMRRLFTLIELLTVVGVIALLAAILLPALQMARSRAQRVNCTSNVRQIGQLLHIYAGDSNDRLPACARLGTESGGLCRPSLKSVLVPTGDDTVFHCPGDVAQTGVMAYWHDPLVGTSYEWNTLLNNRRFDRATLTVFGITMETPLLGDAEPFHRGESRNYLYADGHVESSLVIKIK